MGRQRGQWGLLAVALLLGAGCATAAPAALPTGGTLSLSPSPTPSESPIDLSVAVPDIRFQSVSLAKVTVKDLGLKLSISERTETMDWAPDTILSQNPKRGTLVDPGSKVKVEVSFLPKCDPSYPTLCLKPRSGDVNCPELSSRNFTVLAPDPYHLDKNGDGIGCGRGDR